MPRPRRDPPRASSTAWPDESCDDPVAEVARLLALRLRAALGDRSVRSVATEVAVDHSVISDVLNGTSWPDLATIARLESGLAADLWPGRSRR